MSQFGIIEMTRQRMRPSLKRSVYFDCPHCKGAGLVKTPESMSLDVMRRLAIAINDLKVVRVELAVCPDVAFLPAEQEARARWRSWKTTTTSASSSAPTSARPRRDEAGAVRQPRRAGHAAGARRGACRSRRTRRSSTRARTVSRAADAADSRLADDRTGAATKAAVGLSRARRNAVAAVADGRRRPCGATRKTRTSTNASITTRTKRNCRKPPPTTAASTATPRRARSSGTTVAATNVVTAAGINAVTGAAIGAGGKANETNAIRVEINATKVVAINVISSGRNRNRSAGNSNRREGANSSNLRVAHSNRSTRNHKIVARAAMKRLTRTADRAAKVAKAEPVGAAVGAADVAAEVAARVSRPISSRGFRRAPTKANARLLRPAKKRITTTTTTNAPSTLSMTSTASMPRRSVAAPLSPSITTTTTYEGDDEEIHEAPVDHSEPLGDAPTEIVDEDDDEDALAEGETLEGKVIEIVEVPAEEDEAEIAESESVAEPVADAPAPEEKPARGRKRAPARSGGGGRSKKPAAKAAVAGRREGRARR